MKLRPEELQEIGEDIINEITFFKDEDNESTIYAELDFGDHLEFMELASPKFAPYLRCKFREETQTKANFDFLPLLQIKKDETILFGEKVKPSYRIAGDNKRVVYFLADDLHQTVIINEYGWEIAEQNKYKFLIRPTTKEQVIPIGGKNIFKLLKPFVNMETDTFILFVIFLVQCFFNSSSHFVAVISSEKGSGKSTLTNLTQEIVDPSKATKAILPTSADDITNYFANNMLVAFDNTQKLKDNISDIFCSSVTGATVTKRKLYTDNDEVILNLKNIILLNGIDIVPKKSDLLERSLLFELKKITPKKRLTDKSFWDKFRKNKPQILGAIFDTVSKAIKIKKNLELEKTHRMSDAYTDMCAIALALGMEQNEFIRIFDENIKKLEQVRADENYFCNIIKEYMESTNNREVKEEPMSKFYENVMKFATGREKFMPKTESAFSRKLSAEENTLRHAGYKIDIRIKNSGSLFSIRKLTKKERKS